MKHTYRKPSIQVIEMNNDQVMVAFYSGGYVVNTKDVQEYEGPVIEKMNPSSEGPTTKFSETIWGQAD